MVTAVIWGSAFPQSIRMEVSRVLGSNHQLITVLALSHPFSDPRLRLFVLVIIRRINKISTRFIKGIKQFE